MPWPKALAQLARAGLSAVEGDSRKAGDLLADVVSKFEAIDMHLSANVARHRWGELLGGEEGRAITTDAVAWMTRQGIQNPHRMTALFAPGFVRSGAE
jgi:hypothetical protein